MNFDLTDEDRQLVDVVDKLLHTEWDLGALRDPSRTDVADLTVWARLVDLGLTTLLLPESEGGAGGTMMQARLVARAMGRHLAGTSFVWGAIFPALAVARSFPGDVRDELLHRILDGTALVVPGFASGGGALVDPLQAPDRAVAGLSVPSRPSLIAPYGTQAAAVLLVDRVVVAGTVASVPVVTIDPDTVDATRQSRSDLQEIASLALRQADAPLPSLDLPVDDYLHAVAALKLGLAATATGGLDRACELASEYAATREQFGKPIGSFQAVAHRCVDMRANADGDDMLCDLAAWQLDGGGADARRLAALAKARATRDFVDGSTGALQVYAGHGFSLESDVQLFYRFARGLSATWGTPEAEYASNSRVPGQDGGDLAW
jgi:alkylation response protein AidB-like acyl-CoA dehydrogenase